MNDFMERSVPRSPPNIEADVIPFKPRYRRSREADLWDAYLFAIEKVQREYPLIKVESCRDVVAAFDAFEAERQEAGTGKRT